MITTNILASSFRRAAGRKRMIVLYWFFHTVCAGLAALPALGFVIPQVSKSLYGDELLRQFDLMYLTELLAATNNSAGAVGVIAVLASLAIAVIGSVFLAGGCVKLLVREDVLYSPGEFWEGCGLYFWRFLRLAIYSMLLYTAAVAVSGAIDKGANRLWGEGMEERPLVYAAWARQTLLFLLCGLVSAAMDLAKVRLVTDGSRKSLRACFGSFWLVLTNPATVLPVWLGLAILLALSTWLYVTAANVLEQTAVLFVVQQAYVLVRVLLRMMSWGAAAALDPVLRPAPLPPPEPAFVPAALAPEPPELQAGAQEDFSI